MEEHMQQLIDALDQLEPWQLPEAAQAVVQRLDDHQLLEHRLWCGDEEPKRREMERAKAEAQAEVVAAVAEQLAADNAELAPPAEPQTQPRPWKPWHPLKPETHFYYGDHAEHAGKEWGSQVDPARKQPNVWEPGAPGIDHRYWVEVVPETEQPEQTETGVKQWAPGINVTVGEQIEHAGTTYEVIQAHTTQTGWEPPNVPALFKTI